MYLSINASVYGALKLTSFPGWPVTKLFKSENIGNFDIVGKSIKDVTKNAEKPMPKNVSARSYETIKLVPSPAWPVAKILKSENMENFDIIGKSIRDQKRKKTNA